ncbi:MAG TPA: ester cyclase [Thermomicrobiaceae bacterium]|nr:ester cyclase [Thermomicrobiaceae bacterium]
MSVSVEANVQIVRGLADAIFTQHDFDKAMQYMSPDFVEHFSGQTLDYASWRGLVQMFFAALPDLRLVEIEPQLAEGDKVATRFAWAGHQTGELLGIPSSGKELHGRGISIWRVAQGKVVEEWNAEDMLTILQQLGIAPG